MNETASQFSAARLSALEEAVALMARLRGPGGCAWDREQTFESIQRHTLEETYEVFDAIERRDWADLKDELGDLLLQVLFYAQMAEEAGHFDIHQVAASLNAKLIRRHPHVFGDVEATTAGAVLRNWEAIKQAERARKSALSPSGHGPQDSLLDDVPRSMPALLEASKLGSRAAKVGFDWREVEGVFAKVEEEVAELRAELSAGAAMAEGGGARDEQGPASSLAPAGVEEELGDLLFTVVHLARHLRVDAELALRRSNAKFRGRFRAMERAAGGAAALAGLDPAGQEALWARVKAGSREGEEGDGPKVAGEHASPAERRL